MRRIARLTGDAALDQTIDVGGPCQIEEMRLHLSAASATAEDLTVTLVSAGGAVYSTVLFRQGMNTVADLHWQPTRPINVCRGDQIRIQWTNTNLRTYGIELVWSGLGV